MPGFTNDDTQETHPESYFSGTSNPDSALTSAAGLSSHTITADDNHPSYYDVVTNAGHSDNANNSLSYDDVVTGAGRNVYNALDFSHNTSSDSIITSPGGRFLRTLLGSESGGTNIANTHKLTSSGQARGYFQITTGTWKDFAPRAGVDMTKYPDPMIGADGKPVPYDVQAAVAAIIPLKRWDPITIHKLYAAGVKVNLNATLGANLKANGEGFGRGGKGLPIDTAPTPVAGGAGKGGIHVPDIITTIFPGASKVVNGAVKSAKDAGFKLDHIPTRSELIQFVISNMFKGGTPPVTADEGSHDSGLHVVSRGKRKKLEAIAAPVSTASTALATAATGAVKDASGVIKGGSGNDTLAGGSANDKLTQDSATTLTGAISDVFTGTFGGIFDLGGAILNSPGVDVLGKAVGAAVDLGKLTANPATEIPKALLPDIQKFVVDNLPLLGGILLVILLLVVGTRSLITAD